MSKNKPAQPPKNGAAIESPEQREEENPGRKAIEREDAAEVVSILDVMRASGGEGGYIRLSVKRALDLKFNFLNNIPLTAFSEQFVKDTYGGGEFLVQGCRQGGQIIKTLRLNIDLSIPAKNPEAKKEEAKTPVPDAGTIVREVLAQILPMIKPAPAPDNSAVMIAMMNNQTQMAIENAKSNATMMTAMFSAMANMGKNSSAQESPATVSSIARLDAAVQQLLIDRKSKPGGIEDLRNMFGLIRELQEEAQPEKKENLLSQLSEVAAPFVKAFAGGVPITTAGPLLDQPATIAGAPPASSPQPAAPAAAATPGSAAGQPPNREAAMDFAFNQAMKVFAGKAIQAAKLGMEAEAFADAAEDQIPPMYEAKIFALVSADDWFVKIFGSHPEADVYRGWLTELRDIFVEDFKPEEEAK